MTWKWSSSETAGGLQEQRRSLGAVSACQAGRPQDEGRSFFHPPQTTWATNYLPLHAGSTAAARCHYLLSGLRPADFWINPINISERLPREFCLTWFEFAYFIPATEQKFFCWEVGFVGGAQYVTSLSPLAYTPRSAASCPSSVRVWPRWTPWLLTLQSLLWLWASGRPRRRGLSPLTSGPLSPTVSCSSATANPASNSVRIRARHLLSR